MANDLPSTQQCEKPGKGSPKPGDLKKMQKGDLCFFYHSNIGKEIVGTVQVTKEHYIDKTDKSGRFVAVTVKFLKKLDKPVTLEDIKKNKELRRELLRIRGSFF